MINEWFLKTVLFNFAINFINLMPVTHILYHIVIKPILNLMFFKHNWF